MLASFHEQIQQAAQSSAGSVNAIVGKFRYINPADEHKRRWARDLKSAPKEMEDLRDTLDDFTVFCIRHLKIKTKAGTLEALVLNAAQKKYAATVFEQLKQGKPVRIIILKARQMGFSTVTEALFYYLSSLQEAKNAFIVAQDSSASANLYDMFRLYYENVPEIIKPMRKRNNSKNLTFENPSIKESERLKDPGLKSKITVRSAENKVLARSETIHYLHASELAFWPEGKKKKHLTALFAALSKEPGTVAVIESTAYGMDLFKQIWDGATSGENDYTPLFFPWFEMPDYRMPVPADFEPTPDELELKAKYGVDDEQLMWRRYTIRNDCGGDVRQFRQEYPSYPEESFLLSGDGVFDNEEIQRKKDAIAVTGERHEIDVPKDEIRAQKGAPLVIYKQPEPGARYVLAADTAKGKAKGDWDVAYVLEWRTGEMMATLRGKWETDDFGKMLDVLGRYYNTALLAVEDNNTGLSVLNTLENTCQYPLLFQWRKGENGWNTNTATRPVMVSDFKEAIRKDLFPIYDPTLYSECQTFVDNNGKPQADNGCTDDCIMAWAIALQVRLVAEAYFEMFEQREKKRQAAASSERRRKLF